MVCTATGALLVVGILLSAGLGQLPIGPLEVVGSALRAVGIDNAWAPDARLIEQTLWQIRFPRVVMSLLVGGLLAVAGAVMQAIFGNPLAEPGVVGVSSGAAVGAAAAITLGLTAFGPWSIAAFAFVGGLAATLIVYATSRSHGRTEAITLILTGIAVNAFAGAVLALLMFAGDTASREQIVFWQLGSMNGSRWGEVLLVAVVGLLATALALALAEQYDLLALGDRTAAHLGVRVERLRLLSIVLVALLTGVAVAFVGIIAFVGLVVPHIIRMLLGPANRPLIALSFLGGATVLVYADLLARTLVPSADLPIGILTALIGGPFFYWLIRRNRRGSGGWA
ncbi:iron ABC transporter permease [Microbacterium sp. zg.B48]|uniref:FecCD family ABC transporter permease n=1 Tax=Microbacterium sp. zg-B185 TaxID=3049070 RepID=UPI00214CF64E|nr:MULTISPECIES: iron ABC transporter permease [unclassified Microbacterium]MCR2762658.1 iron ABC transporter permease [Microbacterium sp. zg.B48]MCR2808216.1 iron ABC transporter permease [Microbacterium sp. zg.B185]WIM20940.1 iron ABC transporter permease [Microbacterium sp. zg-B185]